MNSIEMLREFLKDTIRLKIDFRTSDQSRGVPMPPMEQPTRSDQVRIALADPLSFLPLGAKTPVSEAIARRRSRRNFSETPLTLEQLSFLLWATQGQRQPEKKTPHFRTVPSAGARHSFETFLFINRVNSVTPGLYRFLPLSNELALHYKTDETIESTLSAAVLGQSFVARAAAVFVWTTIPYRMEWRYREAAHRVILIDAGHVCQNLYLAAESIGVGTCAIAAYDQQAMDRLLGVDGEDQFTVYLAPVGKTVNNEEHNQS
ncbi:SagB/ThcOx family dehydrogenase [Desulforhopalus singaporensis]|uniref:SagB-type dehydrogenase domain-containing protein n=1 Tax=Desulforhopalus singaporensis TaxID=91360 RepID=A0A1H0TAL2_9BACT|nr:SagB/ThcOx family dehydrogenase [Desulforhopalus singaporensis]SDP51067.1 SagB-type dehydrogenase domain-containing protein [Desulforhopalus singaporensis]